MRKTSRPTLFFLSDFDLVMEEMAGWYCTNIVNFRKKSDHYFQIKTEQNIILAKLLLKKYGI